VTFDTEVKDMLVSFDNLMMILLHDNGCLVLNYLI